jgi:hypothetical protein
MKREGEKKTNREQTDGWGKGEREERRGERRKREGARKKDDWLAAAHLHSEGTSPGTAQHTRQARSGQRQESRGGYPT